MRSVVFGMDDYFDAPGYVRFIFDREGTGPPADYDRLNTRINDNWFFQTEDWM